jgi:2-keto-4-pentenoate hydratase/2-oxohepta-3-ene-1,7-dioic acid hydratase in catechol pathway
MPERRTDHEGEIAVVIGRQARDVTPEDAMGCVAAYCLALDMTVRGSEDRSFRKSCDSYAVLGPWLVTEDEVTDPAALPIALSVNGVTRQSSTTASLIRTIPELIAMASRFYTLFPGDVIMTGTPEGVAPVTAGDVITVDGGPLGTMTVQVTG